MRRVTWVLLVVVLLVAHGAVAVSPAAVTDRVTRPIVTRGST